MSCRYGWLCPRGHFYACDYGDHDPLIVSLLPFPPEGISAWRQAEELGWIHLAPGNVRGYHPATQPQLDKLAEWCDLHGSSLRKIIRDNGLACYYD